MKNRFLHNKHLSKPVETLLKLISWGLGIVASCYVIFEIGENRGRYFQSIQDEVVIHNLRMENIELEKDKALIEIQLNNCMYERTDSIKK